MKFRVAKTAERELDEIFVYSARRAGVKVADKLIDAIAERFALLGDYPLAGRKCEELTPDAFQFPAGDYLIYYRRRRGINSILHIFHGARDQVHAFRS